MNYTGQHRDPFTIVPRNKKVKAINNSSMSNGGNHKYQYITK